MSGLATFAVLLYVACLQLADEKGWLWLFPSVDRKSIKATGLSRWDDEVLIVECGNVLRCFDVVEGDLIEAFT